MDGALIEKAERACTVCGCTDELPCIHHRFTPDSWEEDGQCSNCTVDLMGPLYVQLLRARRGSRLVAARYAEMTAYDQADVLFCEAKIAEDALPDSIAYRARLISIAATALDLAEAIDAQLKEGTS